MILYTLFYNITSTDSLSRPEKGNLMTHKIYFKIFTVILFVTFFLRGYAGTVNGQIQIASSGRGVVNGILTFTLSQPAVISGTATVVTSPVNCYTDATGNVV